MDFNNARFNMVEQQIRPWDVLDFDLLDVLQDIPRELFVPEAQKAIAYTDQVLPLANGSEMTEPKIVARLIQALKLSNTENVLEVGTGSGYGTAILAAMAHSVLTVDVDAAQLKKAEAVLQQLNRNNVTYKQADGLQGVNDQAPYQAILVGGSCPIVPTTLKAQLADGGRLIVMVGDAADPIQRATLVVRNGDSFTEKRLFDAYIAPLQGAEALVASRFTF